jgi:hypothetical protein
VHNAVDYGETYEHGEQIELRLSITVEGQLHIDVTDANPRFPGFEEALRGEHARGLGHVQELGARLTWFLRPDQFGKTVRATLTPGPVDL